MTQNDTSQGISTSWLNSGVGGHAFNVLHIFSTRFAGNGIAIDVMEAGSCTGRREKTKETVPIPTEKKSKIIFQMIVYDTVHCKIH